MAALILLAASSCGFGMILLTRGCNDRTPLAFRVARDTTFGLGIWCLFLFFTGLAGLLKVAVFGALALLGTGFVTVHAVRACRYLRLKLPVFTPAEWLINCSIAFILLITFVAAFAPVTGGITNDEVHTHLSVPAAWLRSGSIAAPAYPVSLMAANGELLFLFATAFSRDTGPHLVSWFSFALTIFFIYSIARMFLARTLAMVAAMMATINPLLFRGAPIAFVDSIASLFMIASLAMFLRWRHGFTVSDLLLAAFYAAVGCGVKPTNVVYTVALSLLVMFDFFRHRSKLHLRNGVLAVVILIAIAAPWPVRLLTLTGSPTYPPPPFWFHANLPQKIIKGRMIPYDKTAVEEFYRYVYSRYGDYRRSWQRCLVLPWEMTMQPERFQIGDSIGTLLLSLLPIGLVMVIAAKKYRGMAPLVFFSAAAWCGIYALVLPEARYFGTAFCAIAPIMAVPFTFKHPYRPLRIGCCIVLIINVLFCTAVALRIEWSAVRMVFDSRYRSRMQQANTPFQEVFKYIEQNRHNRRLVVLYDTPLWYYLRGSFIIDSEACLHPENYRGAWLLDIDYSQVMERNLQRRTGDFAVTNNSRDLQPVFCGTDARLYLFTDND